MRLMGEAGKVIASMIWKTAESLKGIPKSSIFEATAHLSKQMMDYFSIRALLLQKNASESVS